MIPMLCTENNTLITDQKEILNEVKGFYFNLYEERDTLDVDLNNVINNVNIPKLNINQANELEGEITKSEIIKALKRMKNNKSPGSDGYTVEFFKFFSKDLLDFVLRSINYGFNNHELSSTQRQGIITCLPKGEKSKLYLKNWRPITLLNVVYKLTSSCIAERIKKVLDFLISNDQTVFIKGRFIGENTRLVYDVMQQSDMRNIPGLLLLLDFEKAYDSVSWKFMNKVLDFFGFGPQLKAWINLFNKRIIAAVSQCGFLSDFFPINRGCRQGDPVSSYIFILCAEILSIMIKGNENIKGINIKNIQYLISQFADDTTLMLDGTEKSFKEAMSVLELFARYSGLNLNYTKTKAIWIGSKKFSKDVYHHRIKLDWTQENFTLLGIKFTLNLNDIVNINYKDKITQISNEIKIWNKRNLTPVGKITIIKSLFLSKLNHLFASLPNPNPELLSNLNSIFFHFIWNGKKDKVKRNIMTQNYEKGGLKMIKLDTFILSMKLTWIKRLLTKTPKYVELFESTVSNIYKLINRGNQYIKSIQKSIENNFWRDVLGAWVLLVKNQDIKTSDDIYCSCIWNNTNICIDNTPIFYKHWYDRNIHFVQDLINDNADFLTQRQLEEKYGLRTNFLEYYGVKQAIKRFINKTNIDLDYNIRCNIFVPLNIKSIIKCGSGCKIIYAIMLGKAHSPTSKEKWSEIVNLTDDEFNEIYKRPFKSTKSTKLQWFQFRINHRILGTNVLLAKMGVRQNDLCTFCLHEPETICHIFWECNKIQLFWHNLRDYIFRETNKDIDINKKSALFGQQFNDCMCEKNVILLNARFFIYKCKMQNTIPNLNLFKQEFKRYILCEKVIAANNCMLDDFHRRWSLWRNII